jgi:Abnormal spindle-like microcephaly-assoc'd, ASPM-SPD-2-Hydin
MNKCIRLVLSIVLASFVLATLALAATETQKLAAINAGLANLAATQQPDGSWTYGGYEQASTGGVVLAFMSQKDKWGTNAAAYQAVVDNAIAYLLANATTNTVSTRNDGVNICPGGTGSCTGVFWYGAGESTYTTGLVTPALDIYANPAPPYNGPGPGAVATTTGPLAGMTWGQIAQGITNEFSASQSSAIDGNRDGGWRYFIPGNGDSDSSTTQWAVISLIYDETLGAVTPSTVKDHLKVWLAAVQVSGQGGAACYQPDTLICEQSDTGSLLLGLHFVGDPVSNSQVQLALGFLNTNWPQAANNTWYGNFGHPYAMWAVYKGLDVTITTKDTTYITNFLTTCGYPGNPPGNPPGSAPCNWWEDYNQWLVGNQAADGSWPGYAYWYGPLSTSWSISILGATPVPVGSCVVPSPSSIDFGKVFLDRRKKVILTLNNTCTTKVEIGAISYTDITGNPDDFSFHAWCANRIRPGKSCSIAVLFTPDAVGTDTATLNIVTSAPGSPLQVPITATGIKKK